MTLTPRHRAVLDALGEVRGGMYAGSIAKHVKGALAAGELMGILTSLQAAGLVTRTDGAPTLWRRILLRGEER